jgi:adenylate kinase family enzyme
MTDTLQKLGTRICIIGPSNSGKSTLADRLGEKIDAKVFHLDQIAHKENSNWERRPDEDFVSDHDDVINQENWVIDGNYSICMPQRFDRSTAVIWLDPPLIGFLWRYIKRSLKNDPSREGNLNGAQGQFSWGLIKFTFFSYPKNKVKYNKLLENYRKPLIKIRSMRELNKGYKEWGIKV